MDTKYRMLVIFWIWSFPAILFAQDRYAVKYKFKAQSSFSLELPEEYLLLPALERREKEGIPVDSTDLPVSAKYVKTVSPLVDKIVFHSKWLNASVVVATPEQVDALAKLPFIESIDLVARGFYSASLNGKKEALNSPLGILSKPENVNSFDFQNDILGIPAMHEAGFTGEGVIIAVFDAGFLNTDKISGMNHLFENDQILAAKDFVLPGSDNVFRTDAHGTASLSLMASYDPEKLIGGAFGAQYILCITEDTDSEYRIEEYNWIRAAEFSDSLGVSIINSSLGYNFFDDPEMNYSLEDLDGKTAVITKGAAMAANKGILVVSSAGNEGNGSWKTLTPPADADGILAVGSVNNNLTRSSFSSTGPTLDGRIKPELAAFGSGVTVWRQIEDTNTSSGTSFTSPQIAALAAGLWEARPDWTKEQLINKLLQSGTLADSPNSEIGYGIPNFLDAYFGELLELENEREWVRSRIFPNPLDGDRLNIDFGRGKKCNFRLIGTNGQIITDLLLSRPSNKIPFEISLAKTVPGLYVIELKESDQQARLRLLRK